MFYNYIILKSTINLESLLNFLSKIKSYFLFASFIIKPSSKKHHLKHDTITILEHKNATNPLEFTLWPHWPDRVTSYLLCPKCKKNMDISTNHTVTINKNGTITIDPSLLHIPCGAHFWVNENNVTYL